MTVKLDSSSPREPVKTAANSDLSRCQKIGSSICGPVFEGTLGLDRRKPGVGCLNLYCDLQNWPPKRHSRLAVATCPTNSFRCYSQPWLFILQLLPSRCNSIMSIGRYTVCLKYRAANVQLGPKLLLCFGPNQVQNCYLKERWPIYQVAQDSDFTGRLDFNCGRDFLTLSSKQQEYGLSSK